MARAKLEVELAQLRLGERHLATKLFAESGSQPFLAIVAHDSDDDNTVVALCDSYNYEAFKELFASAEEVIRRLKSCPTIMPLDAISNLMELEIKIGRLEIAETKITCDLRIDRARTVEFVLMFSDWDTDERVFLHVSAIDYKRFKNFLRESDSVIESLYAQRQISDRFLITAS